VANETSRLSAAEIFARVEAGAEDELERPLHNLAMSALSAGLAMGISGLGVAALLHVLGHDRVGQSVAYLAYPLGFLIVIIGRQQLFTENTLFPVALVLDQRRYVARTARLWVVVLAGNLLGTLLFALLATRTPAVTPAVRGELAALGVEAATQGFSTVFWTAVIGGWLIALVAWLVTASTDTVGQVLIIFLVTYLVGVTHFAHSIAGSGEALAAVLTDQLSVTSYLTWLAGAVLGNAAGGVIIVALFNYGQVHHEPAPS
jgi:formate/nitrite transporter FocA (FNT family)